MTNLVRLLTDPTHFKTKIENNSVINDFARNNQEVHGFIQQHLSPYLLVRFYQHPLLRIQFLSYLTALTAQEKKSKLDILFQSFKGTIGQTTLWLAGMAFLADSDRSILQLIQTAPYNQRIQHFVQCYPENFNFYIAYAQYESFFHAFRVAKLDFHALDSVAQRTSVIIPEREQPAGELTSLQFKHLPWVLADIEIPGVIETMTTVYPDFFSYYISHLDALRIDPVQAEIDGDLKFSMNKHFPLETTSAENILPILAYYDHLLKKISANNRKPEFTNRYLVDLLVQHGNLLFRGNTPYKHLRNYYFNLVSDKAQFDHFIKPKRTHEALAVSMMQHFPKEPNEELLALFDDFNLQAILALVKGDTTFCLAENLVIHFDSIFLAHKKRFQFILAYGIIHQRFKDQDIILSILSTLNDEPFLTVLDTHNQNAYTSFQAGNKQNVTATRFLCHFEQIILKHPLRFQFVMAYGLITQHFKNADMIKSIQGHLDNEAFLVALDQQELLARQYLKTATLGHSLIHSFLPPLESIVYAHKKRYPHILAYGVLVQHFTDEKVIEDICSLLLESALIRCSINVADEADILQSLLSTLVTINRAACYKTCLDLIIASSELVTIENKGRLMSAQVKKAGDYKELFLTVAGWVLDLQLNKPVDLESPLTKQLFARYDTKKRLIPLMTPEELFAMNAFLFQRDDNNTYRINDALITIMTDAVVATQQLISLQTIVPLQERAAVEMINLFLTGVIDYEESGIEASVPEMTQQAIFALEFLFYLDLTRPENRGIISNVIMFLLGKPLQIESTQQTQEVLAACRFEFPLKTSKNIYHFYKRKILNGEHLHPKLEEIVDAYIPNMEREIARLSAAGKCV